MQMRIKEKCQVESKMNISGKIIVEHFGCP